MLGEALKIGVFQDIINLLGTLRIRDVIDIAVVAIVVYYAIRLVRETRAMQLVKSIGVILVVYLLADLFSMSTLKFLLGKTLDYGLVVLVVLFQPELRRALERLGRSRLADFGRLGFGAEREEDAVHELIEAVCKSVETLSKRYEGALIVIERETKLGDIVATGTIVDAAPSSQLFSNIFFKNSPLHDGAVVVRENRIYAAGCVLPLSADEGMASELGTRHRAALGISEVSDAITVVVSEERGHISVSLDSKLQQNLSLQNLRKMLEVKLLPEEADHKEKTFFFKRGNKNGK